LFTHSHTDHILGLDDLRGFNFVQDGPIPCYASRAAIADLKRIFCYAFEPQADYEGGMLVQLDFHEIESGRPFVVHDIPVQPFRLMHGRMPVIGFRIGDFAYATDCNLIPPESKAMLRNLKCLVLDGLRYSPHNTHFSIPEAIEAAREIGADITYLTHMTHNVDYKEVSANLPKGVKLAYDGLEIVV
jgi:phosphoribosyl 1,2-cyclic phosphate phosphodiesterase